MPKNKGKGGKNRRRGKNENEETKRQLEFKEPGQEYSQVVRMLGNGRCECLCINQTVSRVLAFSPSWLNQAVRDHNAAPSSWRRVGGVEVMIEPWRRCVATV